MSLAKWYIYKLLMLVEKKMDILTVLLGVWLPKTFWEIHLLFDNDLLSSHFVSETTDKVA